MLGGAGYICFGEKATCKTTCRGQGLGQKKDPRWGRVTAWASKPLLLGIGQGWDPGTPLFVHGAHELLHV